MTYHSTGYSSGSPDDFKPTNRRRAGGKSKKSQGSRSKFDQLRSRPRPLDFDDDFDEFEEDFGLADLDEEDDLGDLEDDDEEMDWDIEI